MRGPADEIDRSVAQSCIGFVDRIDQLKRDVEAFALEHAELDRRDRGEIRVRDHVGNGKLHGHSPRAGHPRNGAIKGPMASE